MDSQGKLYSDLVADLVRTPGFVQCIDINTQQPWVFSLNHLLRLMQQEGFVIVGGVCKYFNPTTQKLMATITYCYSPAR